jgi:pyruvate formate lyase activating enzyme
MFKRDDPATSQETMNRLFEIASGNLDHVYMGNTISDAGQNTFCTKCGTIVTKRSGYRTNLLNLDREGKCTGCGTMVYRHFTFSSFVKS